MGSGSSHETQYTYVDNSELFREEAKQKEETLLENERKRRKIDEQNRIAREKKEEEDRRRNELRREREKNEEEEEKRLQEAEQKRLDLEAKLSERREQLFEYTFGSKIGLASFRGVSINDVTKLRIGVFGPTGSGKTCFVNTCEQAVRLTDKGTAPPTTSGGEGTITLQDYLPELFFRLVDTRGFFHYHCNENLEFRNILFGKVKPGDNITRKEDGQDPSAATDMWHGDVEFSDRLHGVIIVVKANDPRLREGALNVYLKPVRHILRQIGISPITVVTHRDTLKTNEECDDALDEASAATGSSPCHTFLVSNYCKDNPSRNPETERMIFDILHFAVMTAERAVKLMKQQEKNRKEDAIMQSQNRCAVGRQVPPDSPEASVAVFLQSLQKQYCWSKNSMLTVQEKLNTEDVANVRVLAMCWRDIQEHFPFGMRKMVEKELRQRKMIP